MGLFCCANKIKKATITKPNQPNHKRVSFPCSCNSNPTLQPFPSRPSSLSRVLCVVCGCDSALQTVDGWQCVVQIWSGKHRNAKTPILLHTPNSCQRCLASSSTTHHSHLVLAHAAFTLSTSTQGQVCFQRLSMRYTPRGRRHLQPMKCKQKKVKITTYL